MTALVAFALLCSTSLLLVSGRVVPLVVFTLLPLLAAILSGMDAPALADAASAGLSRTAPLATLFLCAIAFTGIMRESGVYDPLLSGVQGLINDSPVRLALVTVLLGMIAHLDGSGPTTFLLAIPVLMPCHDRLGVRRSTLVMLLALAAGVMNLLPWGGPLGRAAAASGMELGALWRSLLPAQLVAIVLLLAVASAVGWWEQRRLRRLPSTATGSDSKADTGIARHTGRTAPKASTERRRYPWANAALCIGLLAALLSDILPAWLLFMVALAIALPLNHVGASEQRACLARHAPAAMELAGIVLAAGVLLGMLDDSGLLRALTEVLSDLLPPSLLANQHLLLAAFSAPLHLLLSTDAYYFVLMPVVLESASQHGTDPATAARVLSLVQTLGGYVGPYSTALWLALGMTGVDFATHLRRTLPWAWFLALMVMASAWLLRVW